LVDAYPGYGGELAFVLEDGNRFIFDANRLGARFGNVGHSADIDPSCFRPLRRRIARRVLMPAAICRLETSVTPASRTAV